MAKSASHRITRPQFPAARQSCSLIHSPALESRPGWCAGEEVGSTPLTLKEKIFAAIKPSPMSNRRHRHSPCRPESASHPSGSLSFWRRRHRGHTHTHTCSRNKTILHNTIAAASTASPSQFFHEQPSVCALLCSQIDRSYRCDAQHNDIQHHLRPAHCGVTHSFLRHMAHLHPVKDPISVSI